MVKLIEADPLKQINHFNRWSTLPIDRNFTGIDSFNLEYPILKKEAVIYEL